ncbi:MAG: hypothetical protein M5U28_20755 [Sandaracinaceae bacterium]|nr:hypothetical protein [Sandaracinaceae bacterium]
MALRDIVSPRALRDRSSRAVVRPPPRCPRRRRDVRARAEAPARAPAAPCPPSRRRASGLPPAAHGPLRWILAGGGPTPELNQVQLEQDVLLAREVLARSGPGLTLFAGGPGSRAVQVLDASAATDDLRARLAALFDPRAGRDARYREAAVDPGGAASAEAILAALEGALLDADTPLTLYLAGHGQGGDAPHESRFLAWGAHDLWVEDLAALLDDLPGHRPLRVVITACYSGGFAELVFEGASEERGPATSERCGFFATTWDRAASGCDPNPTEARRRATASTSCTRCAPRIATAIRCPPRRSIWTETARSRSSRRTRARASPRARSTCRSPPRSASCAPRARTSRTRRPATIRRCPRSAR